MNTLQEWFGLSWHWAFSGLMISIVALALRFVGKSFGISTSLKAACTVLGAGRKVEFFKFDWKTQQWNFIFIAGAIIGGFIANKFMAPSEGIPIASSTVAFLEQNGIQYATETSSYLPLELFSIENLWTGKGFILLVLGGICVGFGARYAGGCTSGHAITGLSNLQWPSLLAVIGFFVGGLLMTHFILPLILKV